MLIDRSGVGGGGVGGGGGGSRGAAEVGGPDRLLAEAAGPAFLLLSVRLLVSVPEDRPQKSPVELGGGRGEGAPGQASCFGATLRFWELHVVGDTRGRGLSQEPRGPCSQLLAMTETPRLVSRVCPKPAWP